MSFARNSIVFCMFLFSSCSVKYDNVSLEDFDEQCFVIKDLNSVVYVNANNYRYNFTMFDVFGTPVSSKTFYDRYFISNKFLPNKHEDLFYKILKMIENNIERDNYGGYVIRKCE